MADAEPGLGLPALDHGSIVNARRKFAFFVEFFVDANVGTEVLAFVAHLLHASDAYAARVGQSATHSPHELIVAERRDGVLDQDLGGIFQEAGGIATRIANNHAAGWVGSLRVDSCHLEG